MDHQIVEQIRHGQALYADLRGCNLSGAKLAGESLRCANLDGADLSGADLRGADLMAATLRNANLSRADLTDAFLTRAALPRAEIREATLDGAHLWDSGLICVDPRTLTVDVDPAIRSYPSYRDLHGSPMLADLPSASYSRMALSTASVVKSLSTLNCLRQGSWAPKRMGLNRLSVPILA